METLDGLTRLEIDPTMDAPVVSDAPTSGIHGDRLPVDLAVVKLPDLTLPLHAPTAMCICSGNEVEFDAPDDDRLAPRGLYMLWLVTSSGAPSRAAWVVLR